MFIHVYPIIYRVLYISGPGGWEWDFWTINTSSLKGTTAMKLLESHQSMQELHGEIWERDPRPLPFAVLWNFPVDGHRSLCLWWSGGGYTGMTGGGFQYFFISTPNYLGKWSNLTNIKPPTSFFFLVHPKKKKYTLVNKHSGSWKGWTRIFQMEPFHYWTWGYSSHRYVRNYQRVIEPKNKMTVVGDLEKFSEKNWVPFFLVFLSAFLSFKSFSVFDVMVVVRWRSIPDNKAEFKPFFSEGGRLGGVCWSVMKV